LIKFQGSPRFYLYFRLMKDPPLCLLDDPLLFLSLESNLGFMVEKLSLL